MKYRFIRFILAAIMTIASLALTVNTQASDQLKTALVIGNGAYKTAPLKNPVNDANDMAVTLDKLGFEVIHRENASRKSMKDAIHQFGQKLKKGGVGLFYFAGHGMQAKGRNYLIPVNADIRSESDIEFESIDAGRLLAKMEEAGNDMNIIILDSCRDNPFARSFRSSARGLARMDAPTGSFIAYAAAPGGTAADGAGRNGVFTENLLKHINTPNLTIEKVFKRTRAKVFEETSRKQVTWQSSSLMKDFYFVENNGGKAIDIAAPSSNIASFEEKVATQKTKQQYASLNPAVVGVKIVKRDRHYSKFENGIVDDTRKNIKWVAGPDMDMDWNAARAWVDKLNIDGGGWRMPTQDELKNLYEDGVGSRNMTPLLENTGWYIWSGEKKEGFALRGVFFFNGPGYWIYRKQNTGARVFAVRSR